MGIKSQQDVKNENKAKSEKVPKSMENVARDRVKMRTIENEPEQDSQPIIPLIERMENIEIRMTNIEKYLTTVDQAFEKLISEIENLKNLIKIIQSMDGEISKLTGDIVRISKLEEDRYIELATALNLTNEKIVTFDEYIPVFIDKRINDYFEEAAASESGEPENILNQSQPPLDTPK